MTECEERLTFGGLMRATSRFLNLGLSLRLGLVASLAACQGGGGPSQSLPESGAALFTWGTSYDTDILVESFFGSDHAVMVRFMPQYERSYEGPLFTTIGEAADPVYTVSLTSERAATGMEPHVLVRLGGARALYQVPHPVAPTLSSSGEITAPTPAAAVWRQLFIVRRGDALEVWLDGDHLCRTANPLGTPVPPCDLTVGATAPRGQLRLGNRPIADPNAETQNQFYGFIDDIAVFDHALTPTELLGWFLTGSGIAEGSTGLRTGINFDRPGTGPRIREPASLRGNARIVVVSAGHASGIDAPTLPLVSSASPLELPFAFGETWQVRQEFATQFTHANTAAFCWDFIHVTDPLRTGHGTPDDPTGPGPTFIAASDGNVELIQQQFTAPSGPANFIVIRRGPDEFVTYAHLTQHSARVAVGASVRRADRLAQTSNVGGQPVHLHIAVTNRPEALDGQPSTQLVTRPAYFVDYCVSNDFGITWSVVRFGMPRLAQWVKRMKPDATCS